MMTDLSDSKNKKLVIFGDTDQAQLAHYYFSRDSHYEIVAFTVDKKFIRFDEFCGLPVLPFEDIARLCSADSHDLFIALGYSRVNQLRKEKYLAAKNMGYSLASYISKYATILNENEFGDNCFILEDNTIQPFVKVGSNVTLWSGNHIGHHSIIGDHCFVASHVVVSGRVTVGESCFIGVNATLRDHITVGSRCVIGAGALLLSDADPEGVYIGEASPRAKVPSSRLRGI
ncbi:UDP-N-acetylbacillosamine N-acetyltransferase [mine drainage metagenome]|uniref:UDP-N-acetylbacillosamine N-acetyltransferase n=1 Tax=mine drainage metagenome TaxID=410659 RepID=A0A1J5RA85_9ZZZZ